MSSADVPTMNAGDPREVPRTVDREVLRASLARQLFAQQSSIQVGRFIIIERAGSGGMGVVYRAYDPELEREVAIKILLDKPDDERQRLIREARAAAKVVHPNVVSVFEVGVDDDNVFVAMEYVDGSTLREWSKDQAASAVISMHIQAGHGLAAAHAAGVVHRDYKPDNVLIGPDNRPRVADFGLARALGGDGDGPPTDELISTLTDAPDPFAAQPPTVSGGVTGTPAYMAPEQFLGGQVDEAADQYSFCVALYEGLTGSRPFGGVASFAREPDDALESHSNIDRRVRRVLETGLSLKPTDRFPSMQALLAQLERASAKRTPLYVGIALAGSALVAAAVFGNSREPDPPAPDPCADQVRLFDGRVDPESRKELLGRVSQWNLEPVELVEQRLDEQRESWGEVATEICREHRVDGSSTQELHDAKRTCLDDEARRVSLLVDQVLDADTPLQVLGAFDSTASVLDCANTDVVMGVQARSVESNGQTAVVREQLARLKAKAALTPLAELSAEFEALDEAARQQPDLVLQAETSYALAGQYASVSRYEEAEPLLRRAYRLARRANDVDRAIFVARYLGNYYALYRDNTMSEAETWSEVALAEIDDPRLSTKTVIATLLSASYTDEINGRADAALELRLKALENLREREVSPDDRLTLKVLGELAASYEISGRYDDSEALYRALIERRMALYPNETSQLALITHNFGSMLYHRGRIKEAIPIMWVSLEATSKEDSPTYWIHAANNLAAYLAEDGQLEEAESLLDEIEELLGSTEGSKRQVSYMLEARATVAEKREDFASAAKATEEAMAINEQTLPDDPLNGLVQQRLAYLLGRLGQRERAIEELEQARAQLQTAYGDDHPMLMSLELTRAAIEWHNGGQERAIELAKTVAESGIEPSATEAREALADWERGVKHR